MSQESFTDKKGREWFLAITIRTARDVKSQYGIDLFDLDPETGGFVSLVRDPQSIGDVIAALISPQLKRHNLTEAEVAKDIKPMFVDVVAALRGAYINFCQATNQGKVRRMFQAIERIQAEQKKTTARSKKKNSPRATGGKPSTKPNPSSDSDATT